MSGQLASERVLRAGPAHAAAMAAIHAASFAPTERWAAAAIVSVLSCPGTLGLVATAGGMAIVRVAADQAELLTLAVMPSARRRGLGRLLLQTAMTQVAALGAAEMFLEVKAANVAALGMYTGADFSVVGRRREYYADRQDALVLRARLPAAPRGLNGRPCG